MWFVAELPDVVVALSPLLPRKKSSHLPCAQSLSHLAKSGMSKKTEDDKEGGNEKARQKLEWKRQLLVFGGVLPE